MTQLIGFEDADEIILKYRTYFEKFLVGTWRTSNKSHYFKMEEDGQTWYNLPVSGYGYSYYNLNSGVYRLYKDDSGYTDCFKFTIDDENTMRVFCYQNNETYTLYRE